MKNKAIIERKIIFLILLLTILFATVVMFINLSGTVYAYSNEYGTFFNCGSRDDAYEIFTQYAINTGIMTSSEAMQTFT